MTEQKKCAELVQENLDARMEDMRKLWALYQEDQDASDPDLGNMYEYGLAFDYVAPGTFRGQREGYFRYQISYGGPSDEFRIYAESAGSHRFATRKIEYWYLDWYDGAKKILRGEDYKLIEEIFQSFFVESETAQCEWDKAFEDWEPPTEEDEDEDE